MVANYVEDREWLTNSRHTPEVKKKTGGKPPVCAKMTFDYRLLKSTGLANMSVPFGAR